MSKLTRLGIVFSAKLLALQMALLGLIAGLCYSVGGLIYELATGVPLNAGTALAFLAILGMPLLFAATGAVAGALGAPLYNLLARKTGGIAADLKIE